MGNSFFHFKTFSIYSQEKGLKVNTDACLLGALSEHPKAQSCLDIGTGTGVIALFLAQRFPDASVSAIEIEPSIAAQALHNFEQSPYKQRIQMIEADVLRHDFEAAFDLVVCNPPYYKNHLEKVDSEKNRAIHNKTLDSRLLIQKVETLLQKDGQFYVIFPPHEAKEFLKDSMASGLHCIQEIQIFNQPGKHYRSILCFKQASHSELVLKQLTLKDETGQNTEEFRLLMQHFYLENTEKYKTRNKTNT